MPDAAPPRDEQREQDRLLVDRLVAGENAAWDDFSARYGPRISHAVRGAGVPEGDNGDVCSYVVVQLIENDYRRLRAWDGRARLSTFLNKVARNLAIDYLRCRPRYLLSMEEETLEVPDPEAEVRHVARAMEAEFRERILECLFQMPNGPDREMILFHFHLGLSAVEIARLSGKHPNAIHQAIHRARRSIREVARRIHPELAVYLEEDRRAW